MRDLTPVRIRWHVTPHLCQLAAYVCCPAQPILQAAHSDEVKDPVGPHRCSKGAFIITSYRSAAVYLGWRSRN
jgi:hypothetical protein